MLHINSMTLANIAQLRWFNLLLALLDAKQNSTCHDMFVLVVYGAKLSHWAKSCLIEVVQLAPATVLDAKQDGCCVVHLFVDLYSVTWPDLAQLRLFNLSLGLC
jgi:hypothetical protein